ncbi:MAG TPA: metal-dependent hydrolase [Thermoanaerobaculia bacterium]|nr:metal-dependent hydrolase [Thermoanaerobaculia bacterium]
MASVLSHPAVPLAVAVALGPARVPPALTAAACAASVLPDIDALGFLAGVPYGHPLGHRGFTHSLVFALLAGGLAALFCRPLQATPVAAFAIVFLATASHGVLDAMTTGGLGVAFLSPFSNERFFFPWRFILVSPIGVAPFFSSWGLRVLASELVGIWLPCAAVAAAGAAIRAMWR